MKFDDSITINTVGYKLSNKVNHYVLAKYADQSYTRCILGEDSDNDDNNS